MGVILASTPSPNPSHSTPSPNPSHKGRGIVYYLFDSCLCKALLTNRVPFEFRCGATGVTTPQGRSIILIGGTNVPSWKISVLAGPMLPGRAPPKSQKWAKEWQ